MTIDPMIYALACDRDGRSGAVKYTLRATEEELRAIQAALTQYVSAHPYKLTACECLQTMDYTLDGYLPPLDINEQNY